MTSIGVARFISTQKSYTRKKFYSSVITTKTLAFSSWFVGETPLGYSTVSNLTMFLFNFKSSSATVGTVNACVGVDTLLRSTSVQTKELFFLKTCSI